MALVLLIVQVGLEEVPGRENVSFSYQDLGLGAAIRTAERDYKEEFLDALFSTLAGQRMAR